MGKRARAKGVTNGELRERGDKAREFEEACRLTAQNVYTIAATECDPDSPVPVHIMAPILAVATTATPDVLRATGFAEELHGTMVGFLAGKMLKVVDTIDDDEFRAYVEFAEAAGLSKGVKYAPRILGPDGRPLTATAAGE